MRLARLKARHKRPRMPGQMLSAVHSVAPNLLDRQFEATGPNQKWTADFTYVWTTEGWLFVMAAAAAVLLGALSGASKRP
jgi:putative transposase